MTTQEIKSAVKGGGVLSSLSLEQIAGQATAFVARAFKLKGLTPNDENVRFVCEVLVPKLTEKYNYLTIGEVRLAIEEGCMTGFGGSVQLTPANVCAWIEAYTKCPERKEVANDLRRSNYIDGKKVLMITPEEKEARDRRFNETEPARAYAEYLGAPESWKIVTTGYGHALYGAIRSQGKLGQVSDDSMREARQRAERRYKVRVDPFTMIAESRDENVLQHYIEIELIYMFFDALRTSGKGVDYFKTR